METPRKRALIGNSPSPSPKRARKELKLQLKIEMIKEYESGTFRQTELASKYGIGKSTVSDILKQRDVLKKFYSICFNGF